MKSPVVTHIVGESDWLRSFSIPQFSRHCMEDIQSKEVKKSTRTEIIHTIAQLVWMQTNFPTSTEYTEVCRKLVSCHPVLKDAIGNEIVSFVCEKKSAMYV